MAEQDIGKAIAGDPQEQRTNVVKDFLTKPENLVTALVLAAGLTAQRRPGQSKLNQALSSGIGALGFRGGLDTGIAKQRADIEAEEREAAESAADIARGQAQTTQDVEANRIAAERNTIASTQLTTPRPLPPSEREGNLAMAALRRAQAGAIKPEEDQNSFNVRFQANLAAARENAALTGNEVDSFQIALDTSEDIRLEKLAGFGALTVNDEGVQGVNTDLIPLEAREEFKDLIEQDLAIKAQAAEAEKLAVEETVRKETRVKEGSLASQLSKTSSGDFTGFVSSNVIRLKRSQPSFKDRSDEEVGQILAEVVDNIRNGTLDNSSIEDLQAILDEFEAGLPGRDRRRLRSLIRDKTFKIPSTLVKAGLF